MKTKKIALVCCLIGMMVLGVFVSKSFTNSDEKLFTMTAPFWVALLVIAIYLQKDINRQEEYEKTNRKN